MLCLSSPILVMFYPGVGRWKWITVVTSGLLLFASSILFFSLTSQQGRTGSGHALIVGLRRKFGGSKLRGTPALGCGWTHRTACICIRATLLKFAVPILPGCEHKGGLSGKMPSKSVVSKRAARSILSQLTLVRSFTAPFQRS